MPSPSENAQRIGDSAPYLEPDRQDPVQAENSADVGDRPQDSPNTFPSNPSTELDTRSFIVCGLGSVGQNCVAVLKQYGARVNAVDATEPTDWQLPELPDVISTFLIGDCRKATILERLGIRQCRAILLVTQDERVNTEAAFAARLLNPKVRLVLRSSKQNLNHFLGQNLGNFVAFEPTDLSASAFAFAALGSEVLGFFKLDEHMLQVVKYQIQSGDRWCDRRQVRELNTSARRILCHAAGALPSLQQFYTWEADHTLQAGDTIIYIEMTDRLLSDGRRTDSSRQTGPLLTESTQARRSRSQNFLNRAQSQTALRLDLASNWQGIRKILTLRYLKKKLIQFWRSTEQYQTRRVALMCGLISFALLFLGSLLLHLEFPQAGLREAFSAAFALLLGGYSDVFGPLNSDLKVSWWAELFSLGLTLMGTALVGALYALLTEALLSSKFQFFKNRPPVPEQNHVILIGLGRVGQRIAALLQQLKQPIVGISNTPLDPNILPQLPLVVGTIPDILAKANLQQAKTTLVVLEDDLENLEIGLMVHAANHMGEVVLRTHDQLFSDNVARLFPYARVLCAPALSAEVFAASAYGENVLSLFHLNNQTVLVTEYRVEAGDTLNGLLLADVAYGYGVVPILHQRNAYGATGYGACQFLPGDDGRLEVGDRLIVLATSQSLQRIERGDLATRHWQVHIEKALTQDAIFEGANEIVRVSGCSISIARQLMANLPVNLPFLLYKHQAQRLVRHLNKIQVMADLNSEEI
jgi:Trk K+ transport system NAD-binding subunit